MIRILFLLFEATLQACREKVGGVRTDLTAKKIERIAEPVIDVLLNDVQRNAAQLAHILALLQQLRSALDYAAQARVPDKHVVGLFGQHEFARARQRLEARFGQSRQLKFSIAICEHCEREKVKPVIARLIESFKDAWFVRVATTAF